METLHMSSATVTIQNRMVLSIVVPVYNVEQYLKRCLDSLLSQNLSVSDYEIILIDDGSTDGSGSICDTYAGCNSNVRVIHQANRGLSAARNSGVASANGDYIQFVDSDDYIQTDVLAGLIERIHHDSLDILRFNYENVDESDLIVHPNRNPKLYSDYSGSITDGKDFLLNRLGFACYACQFIVRRDLALRFPFTEGIHFEDTEWVTRMFPAADRVSSTDLVVYFYRIRKGSITKATRIEGVRKNVQDQVGLIKLFKTEGKSIPHPSWYDSMISITVLSVLNLVSRELYPERKQVLSALDDLDVFPLTAYRQTRQAARKIRLMNISPRLYCFLVHRSG